MADDKINVKFRALKSSRHIECGMAGFNLT